MIEILRKMERKTLILLICLLLLPIVFLIFLALIQGCNSKVTYDDYLTKMNNAGLKYIKDYDLSPTEEGKVVSIDLDELVEGKYIKSTDKLLKDSTCTGEVTIRLNGSQFKSNNGGLLNPISSLNCSNYSSVSLKDKIMGDLTTSGSGLYSSDGGYIYRGDSVNNYVKFTNNTYLILGMDSNNIVKLMKIPSSENKINWDTKYNIDISSMSGISDFKESDIRKILNSFYSNIDKKYIDYKKKLVSYDVCIDKIDPNDIEIKTNCSTKFENQIISLPNIWDYSKASLDINCKKINDESCINYNYFRYNSINGWTLNPVSINSYEVYYFVNNYLRRSNSSERKEYNLVIYIDGNELIKSGVGSGNNPYEI